MRVRKRVAGTSNPGSVMELQWGSRENYTVCMG